MIEKYKTKADNNHIPGPRVMSSMAMIAARNGQQLGQPPAPYIEDPLNKWIMGGNLAERPRTVKEIVDVCTWVTICRLYYSMEKD